MAVDRDLDSSKAKSTSTQGGCSREQLKTAPLFLGGLPAGVGMEVDDEPEPSSGDVLSEEATNAVQPMRGACTPARCLGLSSWFLLFWFMQRKGPSAVTPAGWGLMDACAALAGLSSVCGEKRGVIPAGTKQQSQQPKSRR